jgi:hypothetical protein
MNRKHVRNKYGRQKMGVRVKGYELGKEVNGS